MLGVDADQCWRRSPDICTALTAESVPNSIIGVRCGIKGCDSKIRLPICEACLAPFQDKLDLYTSYTPILRWFFGYFTKIDITDEIANKVATLICPNDACMEKYNRIVTLDYNEARTIRDKFVARSLKMKHMTIEQRQNALPVEL